MEVSIPTEAAKVRRVHKVSSLLIRAASLIPGINISVSGTENIPPEGGFIAAFSHHTSHDFIALSYDLLARTGMPVRNMAKEDLFQSNIMSALIRLYGGLPVSREDANVSQLRVAAQVPQNHQVLGIAPEGERIFSREPAKRLKKGVGYIAVMANVPIIPVGIAAQDSAIEGHHPWYMPTSLHLHYGEPIMASSVDVDSQDITALSDFSSDARHAAHDVNKQLEEVFSDTLKAAYTRFDEQYGELGRD